MIRAGRERHARFRDPHSAVFFIEDRSSPSLILSFGLDNLGQVS
jgi:hypothetical protein